MDGFSLLDPLAWDPEAMKLHPAYAAGNAAAWLSKSGAAVGVNHYLSGRLYVSKSGYLLLSVPNALVRGVFDAMTATGAELPTMSAFKGESADKDLLNAHITVMTDEEVNKIGADKINERGHHFHYALGQVREFSPKTESLSRVWAIQVASPELAALRKSYGLSALPNDDHQFHITVAVRRKNVLGANEVAKIDGTRGELKAAADQQRVRVVLPYQDKYLLETLNNPKWPENLGKRRFVGGGVEEGETPAQAAARELFEELGIKVNPRAFRPLGNDPAKPHEHYLELPKHKITPGDFNASVGSDAVISLSPGLPSGADYMGPDLKTLLAPALKKAEVKDILHGGAADHVSDSQFNPKALAEGKQHEHEHTDNDQVAKEIAKDHLSEDPAYYEKVRQIEKGANSVYVNQAMQMFNPAAINATIQYDHNKPVFENIRNQLNEVKRRGDFMLQAQRNHDIWRAQLDPNFRYQRALQAFRGELPQPSIGDQLFERYGDAAINSLPFGKK